VQPDAGNGAEYLGDGQYRYGLAHAEHPDQDWECDYSAAESGHPGDGEPNGGGHHHRDYFQDFFQSSLAKKSPGPPRWTGAE